MGIFRDITKSLKKAAPIIGAGIGMYYGGAFGGFLMALIMADMKPEHRPPWYNTVKRFAYFALAGVLTAGFGKLFFFTPLNPIPDCAFPSILANLGLPTVAALPAMLMGGIGSAFGASKALS